MENVVQFGSLRHMACYYSAWEKEARLAEFKRKQQEIADSYRKRPEHEGRA